MCNPRQRLEYTEADGLMYYGTNTPDLFRRAATYVDKIINRNGNCKQRPHGSGSVFGSVG